MNRIEELKFETSKISVEYTATQNRKIRENLAQKWETHKAELDELLISKCCKTKILQTKVHGNGNGICENCRQETEPIEIEFESNCCGAKIIMADSNGHGKCGDCFENCTPGR